VARKVKDSAETKELKRPDLQRVLRESSKARTKAKEAASSAGGYIKDQIETFELDRVAFGWASKLHGLDDMRRNEIFREFLRYVHLGELLAQADAFDETWPIMREMLDEHEKNAKGSDGLGAD
jgi:hypothetical protein